MKDAALAVFVDPEAIEVASRAGVGSRLSLTLGGRIDKGNSKPIALEGAVRLISDGTYRIVTKRLTNEELANNILNGSQ